MASVLSSPVLSDALVILGAAGIVIPLFARFRITPVIGFIIVGVLVGPHGLGRLAGDVPWLSHITIPDEAGRSNFARFGLIILLFTGGLELSFGRLRDMRRMVFGLGALELLVSAALLSAGIWSMGQAMGGALALGLALAMSSTALVLRIIHNASPVGRAATAMLLFEDIALVPVIIVLDALAPYAVTGDVHALAKTLLWGTLAILALLLAGRYLLPRLFAQAARTKSSELFLAISLLVVVVAALVTAAAGLSPVAGALVAGLLIAETEYHGTVESMTEPFKGLALGVFLIAVGMSIDIAEVWARAGLILAATAAVLLLKALVTGTLLRLMGAHPGTAAEAGILLASPSETTLIVLTAAQTARLISPGTAHFWQIVTALGLTVTPLLAWAGRRLARRVEEAAPLDDDGLDEQRAFIVGFGRVGRLVADMLMVHGQNYVGIDADADLVRSARQQGYRAVFGDAERGDVLGRLGIGQAQAVILTMDEPVAAQHLVKRLREQFPALPIIARARDADHAAALYRAGASHAVPETLEASLQLSEAVLVDLGVAMGPVIASIHEKRDEFRAQIMAEGDLAKKPKLKSASLRDRAS